MGATTLSLFEKRIERSNSHKSFSLKGFDINSIYALLSGLCYAFYVMFTRKLNADSDPFITLSFTAIPGALIMTLLLPFYWEHTPSINQLIAMISLGPIVIAAHFFIIKGNVLDYFL